MKKKYGVYVVVILVIVLLVYVFSLENEVNDGDIIIKNPDDVVEPVDEPGGVVEGLAVVEEVEVYILASSPMQINAVARGYLNDGCTSLGNIRQTLGGNTFSITINKVRGADLLCSQAIVPFSEVVPLENISDLTAGTYTVNVNGIEAEFVLDEDSEAKE